MNTRVGGHCTIVVASPLKGVRKRWRRELEKSYIVLEAASRAELQRSLIHVKPSIVLLDISLISLRTRSSLLHLQRFSPISKIIVLSTALGDLEGLEVLKAGAKGYCHVECDSVFLQRAVEAVQKGEVWVRRSILSDLLNETISSRKVFLSSKYSSSEELKALTEREREIAYLIGRGMSNKEIANLIYITEATVKAHLTNIFGKLRLSDRLELGLLISRISRVAQGLSQPP